MSPSSNTTGEYTQIEANFSLFFGLAVQLYQATLVSDQTPYDRFAAGDSTAMTALQRQGLFLFFTKAKCADCHSGPEFTSASVNNIENLRVEPMGFGREDRFVYDAGFYNLGVRPTLEDISLGDTDPFGYPFSEARLLSNFGPDVYRQVVGHPAPMPINGDEVVISDGLYKTPSLRNVDMTAPYFHNGGFRTLNEVVDFYNRGGDFHQQNGKDVHPTMVPLGLTSTEKNALVAFLKALTDERVRYHRAPFDHPQLFIPNGHVGTTVSSRDNGLGHAVDVTVELPATGRTGGRPLPNFLE
jgi:cytochrome c peroxidase